MRRSVTPTRGPPLAQNGFPPLAYRPLPRTASHHSPRPRSAADFARALQSLPRPCRPQPSWWPWGLVGPAMVKPCARVLLGGPWAWGTVRLPGARSAQAPPCRVPRRAGSLPRAGRAPRASCERAGAPVHRARLGGSRGRPGPRHCTSPERLRSRLPAPHGTLHFCPRVHHFRSAAF